MQKLNKQNKFYYEFSLIHDHVPFPLAARSKAYVCVRSPAKNVGSNPTMVMDVCLL